MKTQTGLSESLEDYLEAILELQETRHVARSKDIAEKLGVQRGSVTGRLKSLAEKGLINYEAYGFITLTPEGEKTAGEIRRRHVIIKDFLSNILQLGDAEADAAACRMEHVIDTKTIETLLRFMEFIERCPRTGSRWIRAFEEFCVAEKPDRKECEKCLGEAPPAPPDL
ncbi:Iron (Metal) dependent repressor, DtxR family [Candidatus Desulfarcum epimagneticum]|uniref:Transcriptional regulator MntR n=1 Tax=uncultured Desulfobacteraceae bacterium TaxID=218296 RepID=A0A484HIT9_9BACT|nr:Iron (Metal) dependent repressor, DtxR family [uncultured Desulfobacteraceae bacterium]